MDLMSLRRGLLAQMTRGNAVDVITVDESITPGADGSGTKTYLENLVSGRGDCMIASPTYAGDISSTFLYNLVFIIYKNGVFTMGTNTSYMANSFQSLSVNNGEVQFSNNKPKIYAGQKLYILPLD